MAETGAARRFVASVRSARWRSYMLPGLALLVLLGWVISDGAGVIEVEPGEVAVLYNNTPIGPSSPGFSGWRSLRFARRSWSWRGTPAKTWTTCRR
jgi:hypothetical protein